MAASKTSYKKFLRRSSSLLPQADTLRAPGQRWQSLAMTGLRIAPGRRDTCQSKTTAGTLHRGKIKFHCIYPLIFGGLSITAHNNTLANIQ